MTKPSLFAQLSLPEGEAFPMPASGGEIAVTRDPFSQSPFVMFFDRRTTLAPRLLGAVRDLQDGDPVLVCPEPADPVRLSPFRYSLFAAKSYFADVDQTGVIVKAAYEKGEGLREHVEAVVFVYTPERLVPARITFKTTKCLAVHRAVTALQQAAEPGWAKLSPDHAASFQAPHPWSRFSAVVSTQNRTSRSSGFKYVMADARIQPTTVGDWTLIAKMMREDRDGVRAAIEGYHRRLQEIDRVAKKGV